MNISPSTPSITVWDAGFNIRQLMSQTIEWWPPQLDSSVKILFLNIQNEVRLRISILITSHWLTLAKLPAASVKQTITHKWEGAMELKGSGRFWMNLMSELVDASLKWVWAWFVTPLVKAWKLVAKKSMKRIPDDSSGTSGIIRSSNGEDAWVTRLTTARYNKLQFIPKWIEEIRDWVVGKSAFLINTELHLKPIGGVLSVHTNLPLGSVDREHARPIFFEAITRVTLLEWRAEQPIYEWIWELQLAPARYEHIKKGQVVQVVK